MFSVFRLLIEKRVRGQVGDTHVVEVVSFQSVVILCLMLKIFIRVKMIKNGSVIISKARSIYSNLALEDHLYNNLKCTQNDTSFLLMWQNKGAVVIGKHQNPWLECNTALLRKNNIDLARRNSGGGTVYHDMGNLNLSFFTPRKNYNRELNLNLIRESLAAFGIKINLSERHDLLWNNFKISGSASKLGRENAYHHCTLLLDVNPHLLRNSLHQDIKLEVKSKATQSVRTSVQNLKDICPDIDPTKVINEISRVYMEKFKGSEKIFIDPTDDLFPGLSVGESVLRSWDWVYGKTPRFIIKNKFIVEDHKDIGTKELSLEITVFHGKIESVKIEPFEYLSENLLFNSRFTLYDVKKATNSWIKLSSNKLDVQRKAFIEKCIVEMVSCF